MVGLNGEVSVMLRSPDGEVTSWDGINQITNDVLENDEVKTMHFGEMGADIAIKNCTFNRRSIDYLCDFLSPTEYKMPKKKNRKRARINKRNKRWLERIEKVWYNV
jgi:hypothetical protein